MDKNAIKKYAVWARTELITRVSQRAEKYDITAEADVNASSVNGVLLSDAEKKQRKALIEQVQQKGFDQVMEEVAYTWFNRFIALRFMEVNGYLPSHIRVFTDDNNNFKPQILDEAIHLELDGLDIEKVYEMKNNNENDELYKYLIITQCNNLSKILPGMFQIIADYTELLFPDYLLREGSVIEQMITLIPEEDWSEQVQIIGWLYQYYISQKKEDVFTALKSNVKIIKENIPAATQLFTPDWIVKYLVENSVGKIWMEGHQNCSLQEEWRYYLKEEAQNDDVSEKLEIIRNKNSSMKPQDITVFDPCSGSGHMLTYAFDVLMQIYEYFGYSSRDAAACIVENNIFGLDIDERAAQLSYFSVMMKARQYDRRFFSKGVQPNIYHTIQSNGVDANVIEYICDGNNELKVICDEVIQDLFDAKEYGSLITVREQKWSVLHKRFEEIENDISIYRSSALKLRDMFSAAEILTRKYKVVITNPPYMGRKSLTTKLSSFIGENYKNGKSELYSTFIEKCSSFAAEDGFISMVTMHTWMFISTFKKLREDILNSETIVSMLHSGAATFEELNSFNVLATAFVRRKNYIPSYKGTYVRLTDYYNTEEKIANYLNPDCRYYTSQEKFFYIQEQPIIYWLSDSTYDIFRNSKKVEDYGQLTNGLFTCDNARFVRFWFEVSHENIGFDCESAEAAEISSKKWFPYAKGGNFRKWYGNNEYVVNYQNNGAEIREYRVKQGQSKKFPGESFYFKPGITWAPFGFENFGVRYKYQGDIFDIAGSSLFVSEKENEMYILAFLASKVGFYFLSTIAPTVNFQIGNIGSLPMLIDEQSKPLIGKLAMENISISKEEWDDYETSWNFKRHPLANQNVKRISEAYDLWEEKATSRYEKLKNNEETMNQIFIDIYGLGSCVDKYVVDRDISLRKADRESDIKSFISYAVGCMFGRYSLDCDGLIAAGENLNYSKYGSFSVDRDNILPVCDDEYFEDDIVERFVEFVSVLYGSEYLEDNLKYISDSIGGKGQPREVIRDYFLNGFFADHVKRYQKKPIYWLFDSGKKNGFKCLIYLHRYKADTVARIRTDYVHELQSRYRTRIADLENRITNASSSEAVKIKKMLKKVTEQSEEVRLYEEKIHHLADKMIDLELDDGIKNNYTLLQDVLPKIK